MSSGVWIVNNSYCLGDGWMMMASAGKFETGTMVQKLPFFEPPHVVLWNLGRHFVKGHAT
mgnify:CR=1 FL=1